MRWDSPFVLATAGTVAIHLILITAGDAIVVTHPPSQWTPAPHVELVEIEVPPAEPPPPPPAPPPPEPEPAKPEAAPPVPARVRSAPVRSAPAPTSEPSEPAPETPATPSGGDEVVQMDDIAPAATGVAVAKGPASTGRVGRGGHGGGTGSGEGAGSGDAKPVSVVRIGTHARPKGDTGYMNLGRDYPPEARALGIEGPIKVKIVIDERGKVVSRVLVTRLGHGLDELALARALTLEFEPATDPDGNPVVSTETWTFQMTLPR